MSFSSWFRDKVLMETPGISGPRFLRKPLERVLRGSRFDPKRHSIHLRVVDTTRGLPHVVTTEDGKRFIVYMTETYFDGVLRQQLRTILYEFSTLLRTYEGEGDLGY